MVKAVALLFLSAILVATPVAAHAEDAPELVPGGGFDGTTQPWFVTQDMVAANTDDRLCVEVPGGTSTAWSSIVGVDGVPIVKGEDYDFSFTAVATTPAPVVIRALVQQPVSPWDATFEGNPSLGGDETEFSYTFNASMDLPAAQVVFQVGGADEPWSLCLDDVSIRAGDPAEAFVPETGTRVRVNQLGYLPTGPKRATLMTDAAAPVTWTLRDSSGDSVATGESEPRGDDSSAGGAVHVIDFSTVTTVGEGFTLEADGETSHPFAIADGLYDQLRYDSLSYFHLVRSGIAIDVPDFGPLTVDVSYGGNYYAIVEPQGAYTGLDALGASRIVELSTLVRNLVREKFEPVHPLDPTSRGVSHVLWADVPRANDADGRNAVFYGDKAIDRSPCGTGTSARLAHLAAKGRLKPGEKFVHESYIGSRFIGTVEAETTLGGEPAIVPSIEGSAVATGFNTIWIDRADPFWQGFQVV